MRHDPIELGLANPRVLHHRAERTRRYANLAQSRRRFETPSIAPDALDEAFATFSQSNSRHRVDPANSVADGCNQASARRGAPANQNVIQSTPSLPTAADTRPVDRQSVLADLSTQITALDRQFEELAELLHGLESSVAD